MRFTWLRGRIKTWIRRFKERRYAGRDRWASPGSTDWLIAREIKYGGFATHIPQRKVSPDDDRNPEPRVQGGLTGGDRMLHHGYAPKYAEGLQPFFNFGPITLVEIGVLEGTGLAIWCDLFPDSRVIGLDLDLTHVEHNMQALKHKGAFRNNEPELYEFDQFADNTEKIKKILSGDTINICIDDGAHSDQAILTTVQSLYSSLDDSFVYFIEDNPMVHEKIVQQYPHLTTEANGSLTVLSSTNLRTPGERTNL